MLARDPELETRIASIAASCGIDPAEDVRRVVVGMGTEPQNVVLVAEGDLAEETLAACVGESMHEVGGSLTTSEFRGKRLYHASTTGGASDVWFAQGSDSTLVVSASRPFLEQALGDGDKVRGREAIADLIDRAGPDHDVWMAGVMKPEVGQGLVKTTGGEVESPPESIFGHADVGDGLEAELGVVMATGADADKVVSMAQPQLGALALVAQEHGLGRLVKAISVQAEGETVYMRASLGPEELRSALSPIDSTPADDDNPASQ
jgi:hypothetical protein